MAARIVPEGGFRLKQRTPRVKNARYLRLLRLEPCCICGDNTSTEAAHLRTSSIEIGKDDHGWGRPNDTWCLPLCGQHHRDQHAAGDELAFWERHGRNPFELAQAYQERLGVPS